MTNSRIHAVSLRDVYQGLWSYFGFLNEMSLILAVKVTFRVAFEEIINAKFILK